MKPIRGIDIILHMVPDNGQAAFAWNNGFAETWTDVKANSAPAIYFNPFTGESSHDPDIQPAYCHQNPKHIRVSSDR